MLPLKEEVYFCITDTLQYSEIPCLYFTDSRSKCSHNTYTHTPAHIQCSQEIGNLLNTTMDAVGIESAVYALVVYTHFHTESLSNL